ncbi:MAG: thiamine ABC transporter ATP-binding protein [Bdellovibrio sp. CG10_big_fil_rev_8_21_14_0_10_47_8]|nr:MAG: thiamine ABC transporter ATP-binding protein [Bdellovibrio sp. CG10_big_fil_rev_8_21_14_0_10_47_8]
MSLVESLLQKYDGFELNISHWELLDQGVTALWGPSGSGKTSVLRVLLGLEDCPSLRWIWKGQDLAKLSTPDRHVGVVFQSLDLFPHLSAEQNIWFAAKARNVPKSQAKERFRDLNKVLQLESFLDRRSDLLSGGEKQRVAFARALMSFPRMLFLDEPFSALDETLRTEARRYLKDLLVATQTPALLITHDPRDLDVLAQKVSEIQGGRIVQER